MPGPVWRSGRLGRWPFALSALSVLSALSALSASSALSALSALSAQEPVDSAPAAPRRATTGCVVSRISDGDTLRCRSGARIRLIGIDAPERDQAPYAEMSVSGLMSLVGVGDTIQLEPDVDPRDRYDRVLAYAWRNGTMINWRMVREGWAIPLTVSPNVQYVDFFRRARDAARQEEKGLWKVDGFSCEPAAFRAKRCS